MPTDKLTGLVALLGAGGPGTPDPVPDAELLARFVAARDEAAFAELARRHGRLVFGVCRRVTGSHHLAEDAFQAVFLVLATRAAAIRPPAAVAAWLHGVAYRTARRARTMAERRRRRESTVDALPDTAPPVAPDPPEAVAVLDEEIARLPERYRVPVVLCELEGLGRKDAAARLGIREGTLSSRLAAARKTLADRLRQRGVVLSAAGLSAVFARTAGAHPPAALAAKAVAALTPQLVPAPVATLSYGVLRLMFLDKLKTVALLCAAALGLAACAALAASSPAPADPPRPPAPAVFVRAEGTQPAPARPKAQPAPQGPNKLLFSRDGHLTLADPDGKNDRNVSTDREKFQPSVARLSPDGKRLAAEILAANPNDPNGRPVRKLYVRGLDEEEPGTDLGVECQAFFWSPDGTELACSDLADGAPAGSPPKAAHFVVSVKTKAKVGLKLPEDHLITDWSRDGRYFLTTSVELGKDGPKARLHLMNRDGTEFKALTNGTPSAMFGRLSPDNARVLFNRVEFPPKDKPGPPRRVLSVLDVATGRVVEVGGVPANGEVWSYCWSPDGKRIAYTWHQVHAGKPDDAAGMETESVLVVCDPDGKNAKTVATERAPDPRRATIANVDWR
jgi:RNA polymerase sigma factor (sigma-70 family)